LKDRKTGKPSGLHNGGLVQSKRWRRERRGAQEVDKTMLKQLAGRGEPMDKMEGCQEEKTGRKTAL
jgi:hypothetical protein